VQISVTIGHHSFPLPVLQCSYPLRKTTPYLEAINSSWTSTLACMCCPENSWKKSTLILTILITNKKNNYPTHPYPHPWMYYFRVLLFEMQTDPGLSKSLLQRRDNQTAALPCRKCAESHMTGICTRTASLASHTLWEKIRKGLGCYLLANMSQFLSLLH
jgi:hypothetical protein